MTNDSTSGVPLRVLARAIGARVTADLNVREVTHDSRRVSPGALFVAIPGTRENGAAFAREAVARGAVAVAASSSDVNELAALGVPVLAVNDARAALARLSGALHGDPARELRLIGITGTLGKTSTALLVQAALAASSEGRGVGVVGSLGARVAGRDVDAPLPDLDGMTTPDPPALHHALRRMADAGVRTVAMEVTSHALVQHRVDGLSFALGVLTNLVPDEHLDFHGTEERYLRAKARFFEHLAADAPIVFNADDVLVRQMVRSTLERRPRPAIGVALEAAQDAAAVTVEQLRWDAGGSTFVLSVREPLRTLDGDTIATGAVPIVLPVLGVQQVANAALAATAAMVAGATALGVTQALAELKPARRRMEVVRAARPLIIDDTAGHPETLRVVFRTIEPIARRGLRVAFGLRGSRGVEINARLAESLAELVAERARREPVRLVVTWSDDTAGPRDRVTPDERDAALGILRTRLDGSLSTVELIVEPTLAAGIARLLDGVREDELVLLLGPQGMDRAAELARTALS
jgi:UDP-N-acetylmuramoyl-L-alanyl-D-glutamate--2,6-diaminopimelate ligase